MMNVNSDKCFPNPQFAIRTRFFPVVVVFKNAILAVGEGFVHMPVIGESFSL
jgi:hypothetical protein